MPSKGIDIEHQLMLGWEGGEGGRVGGDPEGVGEKRWWWWWWWEGGTGGEQTLGHLRSSTPTQVVISHRPETSPFSTGFWIRSTGVSCRGPEGVW